MTTFEEILNKKLVDISDPQSLPSGTYAAVVNGQYQQVTGKEKGTPGFVFTLSLIRPIAVDDMDDLAKMGGASGKSVRYSIYVSEASEWRLKQFLGDHLGIEMSNGAAKKSIGQALAEINGRNVAVVLKREPRANNESGFRTTVESTAKL